MSIGEKGLFNVYDILCSNEYNPNARTGWVSAKNIPRMGIKKALHEAIREYYKTQLIQSNEAKKAQNMERSDIPNTFGTEGGKEKSNKIEKASVKFAKMHQCPTCMSIYDEKYGEPDLNIPLNTPFDNIKNSHNCAFCNTPMIEWKAISIDELYVI